MTEHSERLHTLMDDAFADEPPLRDLVPQAVTGAAHSRRRRRAAAGGAAVAVLAVGFGAYRTAGPGNGNDGPGHGAVAPGTGPKTTPTTVPSTQPAVRTHGIPGLFDHPGTPQEQCANLSAPVTASRQQLSSKEARDYCARALTQIRALLPDATVVLDPQIDFDQPHWSAPLIKTPDGAVAPGFVEAYQQAARTPSKVLYSATDFAFRTAHGEGTVYYQTTLPGAKAKPAPGGDLPLGDGTSGRFGDRGDGAVTATGVTADGMWYDLSISGVYPVYGASGSTAEPGVKGDGNSHELFPDGYVAVVTPANPHLQIPNPYTEAQLRDRLTAQGLGTFVRAVGANPLSLAEPPQ